MTRRAPSVFGLSAAAIAALAAVSAQAKTFATTTTAVETATSSESGVIKSYTSNPLNAVRLATWVQGQANFPVGRPIDFGNAVSLSTVPGFINKGVSGNSQTVLTQTITNTSANPVPVTVSSVLQHGAFGMEVQGSTCANLSAASCGPFFGSGRALPKVGTSMTGFNVAVAVNGANIYSLAASLNLTNGVFTPNVVAAAAVLKGFATQQVTFGSNLLQNYYAWADTPLFLDLAQNLPGDVLQPGQSLTWTYSLTAYGSGQNPSSQTPEIIYTSVGDPFGGGGQIHGPGPGELWGFAPFAVPEPATWTMMLIGLGAAGGALRRRRLVAAA